MHLTIDLVTVDEVLLLLYLVVWLIRELVGIVRR